MGTKKDVNANQLRTPQYEENLVKGGAVNSKAGSRTQFNTQFPKGPMIYETWLRLAITLTLGTAATPITDGILNFISQIYMKGDNGEVFVDNVSARALIMGPDIPKAHTVPAFDQITATDAKTFYVNIPIYHWDPLCRRPEDTFLDSRRYQNIELNVTVGNISDLFTTPGTASVVITADIDIVRSFDDAPDGLAAIGYTCYVPQGVLDPTTQGYWYLLRSTEAYLKRLYLQTASAANFWYGPNVDNVLLNLRLTSSANSFLNNVDWNQKQQRDKTKYRLESVTAGRNVIDFVRDGSNKSALYTDRNNLRLEWDKVAALGAGNYVSILGEYYRKFKNAA